VSARSKRSDLQGKWLAVWLSLEEVFGFGPLATGSSEVWMVAGRIVGESPTGLWLRIENVSNEKNQSQLGALTTATPTYLLPWHRISSVRLLDEKPGPRRGHALQATVKATPG
jgi:hypothetical protein